MHELAICEALITQVEGIARDNGATEVTRVVVKIGPLSGVEMRLLEHAYPVAAAGSVAEDAALEMESMPVRVRCQSCNAETEASANRLICGECGDYHTQLISGDEMLLASVEFEKTLH